MPQAIGAELGKSMIQQFLRQRISVNAVLLKSGMGVGQVLSGNSSISNPIELWLDTGSWPSSALVSQGK
jgi:hypothetical protein